MKVRKIIVCRIVLKAREDYNLNVFCLSTHMTGAESAFSKQKNTYIFGFASRISLNTYQKSADWFILSL